MGEFWKTVRAYRSWIGWVIVGATLVVCVNQGWISEGFIDRTVVNAVSVIQALVP